MVDIINSIFEFGALIAAVVNIIKIYKDKKVRGVYWPAWIFYGIWSLWAIFYYITVSHWFSMVMSIGAAVAILMWLIFAFIYRDK